MRGQLRPVFAAVGGLEDSAARSARLERPRRTIRVPERRVYHVGIGRIEHKIGDAGLVVAIENAAPRLAAVGRLEDATLRVRPERMTEHADPDDVGIGGMNANPVDVILHVAGFDEAPCAAVVLRHPHAIARRRVAANVAFPAAGPSDVGSRFPLRERADRAAEVPIRSRPPVHSAVGGLEHTAPRRAHPVFERTLRRSGDRQGATAPVAPELALSHAGEGGGVEGLGACDDRDDEEQQRRDCDDWQAAENYGGQHVQASVSSEWSIPGSNIAIAVRLRAGTFLRMVQKPGNLAGDIGGGVSAMLVALPSAIAFGVTIFAPLGGSYAAQGAIAGILGATALGLVTPVLGGTNRLISAPCAPAAAVLSALAIELVRRGIAPEAVALMLAIVALLPAALQITFGAVGLGRLIKFMPYPVVSGYLSGVGLLIIIAQLPKLLGAPKGTPLWEALTSPSAWQWHGIVVGVVTVGVMLIAPKLTKALPATILGLVAGVATYFAFALADRSMLSLAGNAAVVGPLVAGSIGGGFFTANAGRVQAVRTLHLAEVTTLIVPALSLAVLLSIDTLKTCVVVDAITRSRHDERG